mmetsp:Transcript_5195/g.14938  ORF Transcript_5195/g.14938 Transcript_5195/m.14938 type:complete len:209 (+) Transcript_5195:549-1175(+)
MPASRRQSSYNSGIDVARATSHSSGVAKNVGVLALPNALMSSTHCRTWSLTTSEGGQPAAGGVDRVASSSRFPSSEASVKNSDPPRAQSELAEEGGDAESAVVEGVRYSAPLGLEDIWPGARNVEKVAANGPLQSTSSCKWAPGARPLAPCVEGSSAATPLKYGTSRGLNSCFPWAKPHSSAGRRHRPSKKPAHIFVFVVLGRWRNSP